MGKIASSGKKQFSLTTDQPEFGCNCREDDRCFSSMDTNSCLVAVGQTCSCFGNSVLSSNPGRKEVDKLDDFLRGKRSAMVSILASGPSCPRFDSKDSPQKNSEQK